MKGRSHSLLSVLLAAVLLILGVGYPTLADLLRPSAPPPPSPFAVGEAYLQQGAFYRAERAYRQALDDPQASGQALGRLGLLALIRGDPLEASWQLQAALQIMPEETALRPCLGLAQARRGNWDAAAQSWTEALDGPAAYMALGLRGEERYRQGDMAGAQSDFSQLLAGTAPTAWQGWAHLRLAILESAAHPGVARTHLLAAQQLPSPTVADPFPSPELLYGLPTDQRRLRAAELAGLLDALAAAPASERELGLGQMLLSYPDPTGAAYVLEQAAQDTGDVRIEAYLGYALCLAGRGEQGETLLQEVLEQAPYDPLPHHLLGRLNIETEEIAAATQQLEWAVSLSPGDPALLYDLARAAHRAGDYTQANRWMLGAVEAAWETPMQSVYDRLRLRFYLESGWEVCERGLPAVPALLERAPDAADTWLIAGGILSACGRPGEAIPALWNAIRLNPHSAEAYDRLGTAHLLLGDESAAAQAFAEAADHEPWTAASQHARSWLEEHPTLLP